MRRLITVVGALALSLSVLTPAHAAVPEARDITDACPPGVEQNLPFTDVTQYEQAIGCLWHWEVTRGTTTTTYSPSASVTRGDMASFVARVIRETGFPLPVGADHFTDDDGSPREDDINALATAGVVQGVGGTRYAPGDRVNRGQMAAFLVRSYELVSGTEMPAGSDYFPDDDGHNREADIDKVARAGLAGGYGDGTYRPGASVRRDHMALFLARWLDLAVESGLATAPAPTPGASTFGPGTHLVGRDIQPGLYTTTVDGYCYWERLSGTSGDFDDIIANDFTSGARVYVQILATDVAFFSDDCGTWRPASTSGTPGTTMSDGMWRIGIDVKAGTYRAEPVESCYWERLSGATGEFEDIIANDFTDGGPVVVTLSPTDWGFASSDCGTWTLVS